MRENAGAGERENAGRGGKRGEHGGRDEVSGLDRRQELSGLVAEIRRPALEDKRNDHAERYTGDEDDRDLREKIDFRTRGVEIPRGDSDQRRNFHSHGVGDVVHARSERGEVGGLRGPGGG